MRKGQRKDNVFDFEINVEQRDFDLFNDEHSDKEYREHFALLSLKLEGKVK